MPVNVKWRIGIFCLFSSSALLHIFASGTLCDTGTYVLANLSHWPGQSRFAHCTQSIWPCQAKIVNVEFWPNHYHPNSINEGLPTCFFFLYRALMDCLVLPIQNKLEEWRKITHALEREHAKGTSKITKQILFSLFPKTSISFHMDVTQ